jgi:bifunctional DNase/RNase
VSAPWSDARNGGRGGSLRLVPLEIVTVAPAAGEQVLVLRERGGRRLLPVTVGPFEAAAIRQALGGHASARPSPHELLAQVIVRLGGRLERVCIHDLREETFFSQLELRGEAGLLEVDCRTSDAVVLAIRCACPILVEEEVLQRAGVLPRPRGDSSDPIGGAEPPRAP